MKKKTKTALITAAVLMFLGIAISYGALASIDFDWSRLNMTIGNLSYFFG